MESNAQLSTKMTLLAEAQRQRTSAVKNAVAECWRLTAVVVLYLVLLFATIGKAWAHAASCVRHKTYGFVAKWSEAVGWVQVLTVVGVPIGLGGVISGQVLLIYQRIQENLEQQSQRRNRRASSGS